MPNIHILIQLRGMQTIFCFIQFDNKKEGKHECKNSNNNHKNVVYKYILQLQKYGIYVYQTAKLLCERKTKWLVKMKVFIKLYTLRI